MGDHILNVGDLLEIPRGLYSHWAVYIGNEKVVHLAGGATDGVNKSVKPKQLFTSSGVKFSKAKVRIDDFSKVAAGSKVRKNNTKDKIWRSFSPAQIVRNARSEVGTARYNLLFSNCEHFTKRCRYGISQSDQVDNVLKGVAVGATVAVVVAGIVVLCKLKSRSSQVTKTEERK